MENVFEDEFGLLDCWLLEIHPQKEVRVRQEGRHEKYLNILGVQATLGGECERANHEGLWAGIAWRIINKTTPCIVAKFFIAKKS